MIQPSIEYKELKTINNIKDIAYNILFEKYIRLNIKGQNKVTDIDSTDEESIILKLNGGRPIPGMTYTFIYGASDMIDINNMFKEYKDMFPIIMCYNVYPDHFMGINFNMMPNEERLKFLDAFYKTFKIYLENIELDTENNKLSINEKFIKDVRSGNGPKLIDMFNKMKNANFGYAFRKYNINNVKQLRMIEMNEWKYIPFYDSKETFKKVNDKIIQSNYYKSK